jgi:hypothetical protein
LVKLDRTYSPETIAVMTAIFDRACETLSARNAANDDVRRTLALTILRSVDQGERDPTRLAYMAFRELARVAVRQAPTPRSAEDLSARQARRRAHS